MQLKIVESGYQVYNNETVEFCNVNFITQKAQGLCVCVDKLAFRTIATRSSYKMIISY